jgi:hypothetical protein
VGLFEVGDYNWAEYPSGDLDMNINEIKQNFEIIDVDIFNLMKKRNGALAKRKSEKTICTLWKGSTSEMLLVICSNY